jgi:hypothetical protein
MRSIDWVHKDGAPRVELTMILNVGVFDETKRYLINAGVEGTDWLVVGGPKDAGYGFISRPL